LVPDESAMVQISAKDAMKRASVCKGLLFVVHGLMLVV